KMPTRGCFYFLGLSAALFNLSTFIVMGHLVAFGEEQGFAPLAAASLISVMLGVSLFSRLSVGYMSDRHGAYRTLAAMAFFYVVGVLVLVAAQSYLAVVISVSMLDFGFGGYLPGYAILVRKMFPANEVGRRITEIYFL